jgi:hypothetical protein
MFSLLVIIPAIFDNRQEETWQLFPNSWESGSSGAKIRASLLLDVMQFRDSPDVNQMRGLREPQFHHREQAVPSCQNTGTITELLKH